MLTRMTLWLRTALIIPGEHWAERFFGIGLGNMRIPSNSVTFSQKFADNMRTNKARGTGNLPVDKPVRTHDSKWIIDGCHTRE